MMVGVGEVADSDGIYRTIREGCPFLWKWDLLLGICAWVSFVGIPFRGFASGFLSGDLLLGFYLGISGKSVSPVPPRKRRLVGYHGDSGAKRGDESPVPLVEHFVWVTAGIPKCLKPPTSLEMSAHVPCPAISVSPLLQTTVQRYPRT